MTDVTKFIDKATGEIHIGETVIGPNLNWDNIVELAPYGKFKSGEQIKSIRFKEQLIASGIPVEVYAAVLTISEIPTIRFDCLWPDEYDDPTKEWNYRALAAGKVWLKAVLGEPDWESECSIRYKYSWGMISIFVSRDKRGDLSGGEIFVKYERN